MSSSVFSSTRSLIQMFDGKVQEFINEIENVHMVWLEEIQQEANRMFSSDFSAEPELMPKTPSQKKTSRRRRISLGQDGNRKRRCSRGKRSNLRRSSVNKMILIAEDKGGSLAVSAEVLPEEPKHSTCKNKQSQSEVAEEMGSPSLISCEAAPSSLSVKNPGRSTQIQENNTNEQTDTEREYAHPHTSSTSQKQMPEAMVKLSAADRLSAEMLITTEPSPGRSVAKIAIAGAASSSSRRSSVRHSLTLRRSLAGLRHSRTQESVRRASRRSFLKKKASVQNFTSSSNVCEDVLIVSDGEDVAVKTEGVLSEKAEDVDVPLGHTEASADVKDKSLHAPNTCFTRSMAQSTPTMVPSASIINKGGCSSPDSEPDGSEGKPQSHSTLGLKRQAVDAAEDFQSLRKKPSPPKKSQTAIKPNMRSFLRTVQKNQLLMMTPSSLGRSNVMKSFIKHATPLKVDHASSGGLVKREQLKLEALKKKQEQEEERMRKMEEEKKRRQEEMKRKRDERLRRVVEARVKEEQSKEEKKKKIEQKMAQIDEKNDKLREERLAEEKAKKKVATKRQEELEQRRKLEEETRKKKIQEAEEEEKRLLELQAKRRAEEEQERARKLAEARRAMELKKEQELERKRQAAAERERMEQEKALALQREVEKAAREKEIKELEEKRKELEERRIRVEQERQAEEQRAAKLKEAAAAAAAAKKALPVEIQHAVLKTPIGKGPGLNVTVDIEGSPQSYDITPKGGNKPVVVNSNAEDYGMDQNSDDSTDDESAPRKPIPSWAEGLSLKQSMMKQYFNPMDLHAYFGEIEPLKLENIFYKSKPRYFKRTSSAVWHSPPQMGTLPF